MTYLYALAVLLLVVGVLRTVGAFRTGSLATPPRSPERARFMGPAVACFALAAVLLAVAALA